MGFPASIVHVRNYAWLRVRSLAHRCVNNAGGEDGHFHVRKLNKSH